MTSSMSDQPADVVVSTTRKWLIMVTVVLASTIYNATVLIASGLQPQMQGAMSATQDEIAWTVTFNILATAIVTPMTGWLVSRYGSRLVMVWSVGLFTLATLLCGLAHSLESLVLWRILQGGGGAAVVPLGQTILLNIFPAYQHGLAISVFGVANMAGPVIGPALGGTIAELWSWRWVFYLTVPVGVIAFVCCWFALPKDRNPAERPFDWMGFLTLSASLALAQLVLSRGQRLDWFESPIVVSATVLSAIALYMFVAHSLTASKPFLDVNLLRDRNYALGLVLVAIYGMLNFTPMVLLPQLLQAHAGYPDSLIGTIIAWRGAGAIVGFFLSNWLVARDARIAVGAGFALQAISGAWMATLGLDVGTSVLAMNGFIQGFAIGIIWVPMSLAAFHTLPAQSRAEAMAIYHLVRNIGSSFFISLSVAEIVETTTANYSRLAESVSVHSRTLELPWVVGAWGVGTLPDLAKLAKEINRQAAMIGYLNAFVMYGVASAAAIPFILLMRSRRA